MIKKIKKIIKSDLVKVFSFTGLSTLIKLITGYVTVKFVASIIGPSGIALIGQLQNFSAIFTTFGAGGINNGVVKYVSENKEVDSELQKYLRNGFKITIYFSIFFGLLLILLSTDLSKLILLDAQYNYVFICFGVSLLLISLNNYFLSILNGFKEFKKFVLINIITSLLGLIFTVSLVLLFQLKGALIATVSYQGVVVFITIYYLKKTSWFSAKMLWGVWNKDIVKKYFSYSLMAFVSAATQPVSQLLVRGFIIKNYSIESAGFWEGMNRISGLYLLFVTTSFSVYYLPKLSEIRNDKILKSEIIKTYKLMIPLVALSLLFVFLLKDIVINILFTEEFYPMKELFLWQLLGDFFKIMSWILAFVMVAKSMTKKYIFTEIFFSISLVLLSYIYVIKYGVVGATVSYGINYFLYLIVMLFLFRKLLFTNRQN
jgi:O-antigen/teichoic acid export membrane protein